MPEIVKKCIYCVGEIKSCNDFYGKETQKEFEKMGIPKSENYNCIECGQIYDKFFKPMKFKLGWLKNA